MTDFRTSIVSTLLFVASMGTLIAQQPTVIRTELQRADMSVAGREGITARAEIPLGGATGRHTHPGEEISYLAEGTITLEIEGSPARQLKAGDVFFIPSGAIHNATAVGGRAVVIANYIVTKGQPLATPAK